MQNPPSHCGGGGGGAGLRIGLPLTWTGPLMLPFPIHRSVVRGQTQ